MIAQQHALTNKISTGSSKPQTAREYSLSKKIRINISPSESPRGYKACDKCRANARSNNPGNPPVHPRCRCQIRNKK